MTALRLFVFSFETPLQLEYVLGQHLEGILSIADATFGLSQASLAFLELFTNPEW